MDIEKTICKKCTGETVVNGYCHNCGDGEKPEAEDDLSPKPTEDVQHTITQEDLDANPGLEAEVKVGDEITLPVLTDPKDIAAAEAEFNAAII